MSIFKRILAKLKKWLHKHDGGERPVSTKGRGVKFENKLFFPIIIAEVNQGHTVTINLKGRSMRPFLESDRDKAVLTRVGDPRVGEPRVGDPILAEVQPDFYVLHRIVKMEGDEVTLMGDGNLGYEHCKKQDFRASVIGFYRKGSTKLDSVDGRKWRIYSWWWTRLRPIRRYLLAAYRYIWLNIFRLK